MIIGINENDKMYFVIENPGHHIEVLGIGEKVINCPKEVEEFLKKIRKIQYSFKSHTLYIL